MKARLVLCVVDINKLLSSFATKTTPALSSLAIFSCISLHIHFLLFITRFLFAALLLIPIPADPYYTPAHTRASYFARLAKPPSSSCAAM
jgi:hypothetical protein